VHLIKNLYFCEHCRKKIPELGDIHFVEENSDRGFCSEQCILNFYKPYMQEIEKEESFFRSKLNLPEDEGHNELLGNEHYLELALNQPHEVWILENDLEQTFFTHILTLNVDSFTFYFILICTHVEGTPSFVFYRTLTGSEELVAKYRRDFRYEEQKSGDAAKEQGDEVSEEIIEEIELKKSSFLAHVLQLRSENDIPLEHFLNYDKFLERTVHNADEIYEYIDEDDEALKIHIKSFVEDKSSFFYIVVLMKIKDNSGRELHVPIIGFPSTDQNLYKYFATGKRLSENLKN
tara:strand:+ start:8420 stop:9292 length:873 start_codon:yes stop_codon:yes gene_type:complete